MASELIRALSTLADRKYEPGDLAKFSKVSPSQKADADRKADEKALSTWRRAVQRRDGTVCRCCKRRVSSALTVAPERRECHHIAPRADAAVRYDRRNGLLLCLADHERIERGQLHLVQKAALMFRIGTKVYINGDKDVKFITKG